MASSRPHRAQTAQDTSAAVESATAIVEGSTTTQRTKNLVASSRFPCYYLQFLRFTLSVTLRATVTRHIYNHFGTASRHHFLASRWPMPRRRSDLSSPSPLLAMATPSQLPLVTTSSVDNACRLGNRLRVTSPCRMGVEPATPAESSRGPSRLVITPRLKTTPACDKRVPLVALTCSPLWARYTSLL